MQKWMTIGLGLACIFYQSATARAAELTPPAPTVAGRPTRQGSGRLLQRAAGDLRLSLQQVEGGIRLSSLYDLRQEHELFITNALPLFDLVLRRVGSTQEVRLVADAGWSRPVLRATATGFDLRWAQPQQDRVSGLEVHATATVGPDRWRWKLEVRNRSRAWSVWRVIFPQVALADLGETGAVLFPRGPGEVQTNVWTRGFQYHGNYPGGWCAMQFMAAYRAGNKPTGLYLGRHDPYGSTKDLNVASDPAKRLLRLSFEEPAPDMGLPGNSVALEGETVWQLLRGDWFDAASIYKAWAKSSARWWPPLGEDGRDDTPLWMRQLNAWAMTGGGTNECVRSVRQFRDFLGVPVGFHWYNWHQIPFDNDYPHYFPAKPGFREGVRELQQAGVFVMPYINGRLWDTLDRGATDFEFTAKALAAATKQVDGNPYTESYGSKETNGQPVRLAAMCPATPLWQHTVSEIVSRLLKDEATKGVYIDQVAAAAPTLCMDSAHGHPLGGGHWWTEGYWKLLTSIRQERPRDAMLTTECNGEPFIRWFDGYLTWHWQFDGQVPAFPAVYGGAIQMFGRAYRGGATKDLALRMKAAQQLVFGEQLGWLEPAMLKDQSSGEFFRQLVVTRARFNRYFYAGEMARPPRLEGDMPRVKADWQWSGEWWVNTDAVLTGAWRIARENRVALFCVNVSAAELKPQLRFDGRDYGFASGTQLTVTPGSAAGSLTAFTERSQFAHTLDLAPHQALVLEVHPAKPER